MNILDKIAHVVAIGILRLDGDAAKVAAILTILITCIFFITGIIWMLSVLTGLSMWWGWLAIIVFWIGVNIYTYLQRWVL